MKIGIIGQFGHFDAGLDPGMQERGLHVVAISPGNENEPFERALERARDLGHEPRVYGHAQDLLDNAGIDIAVVSCVFSENARVIQLAVNRGIHIISEKPVATNLAELESVWQSLVEQPVHFTAMHTMRYNPAIASLVNAVRKGDFGALRLIQIQKSYILGERPNFFFSRERHGGLIPWVGVHAFDLARWITVDDMTLVDSIHTRQSNGAHGDLETAASITLRSSDHCLVSITLDYLRPLIAKSHADDRIRVVGEKNVGEFRQGRAWLQGSSKQETLDQSAPKSLLFDFVDQIAGVGSCRVSAEDAIEATYLALLARDRADRKEMVKAIAKDRRRR